MSLLLRRSDRSYLVEPGERLETDLGIIDVPVDVEPGTSIESHLGKSFDVLSPRPTDLFHQLDRSGAPMLPRDVGLLVGMAGLQAGDEVLDVGTGSGVLAITLARLGMSVTTYERDGGAVEIARENVERAGVSDAIQVRHADASGVDIEGRYDAMTLDTGDAPLFVEQAHSLLNPGGVLAAYAPFVEAARTIERTAVSVGFGAVDTYETVQRTMDFDDRGSRPSTGPVGHSGYLSIATDLHDFPE